MSHTARILIVDDSRVNINMLGALLSEDYEIIIATDGDEAIARIDPAELPDLILLDIVMPGMNGYEVCRILKSDALTKNIPIIFITAKNSEDDETRGFELGAVDYITKPFSAAIVQARIRTHLELKRHRDLFERLSTIDGLTGIANRRRFDECIQSEWQRAQRLSSPIGLIMADIDHFKAYNDFYGHQQGDACLKQVAETLADSVANDTDLVARYGGEEFVCVLPHTDSAGVVNTANRVLENIQQLKLIHAASPVDSYVTVSMGCLSVKPKYSDTISDFILSVDKYLYAAKREGRNQVKSPSSLIDDQPSVNDSLISTVLGQTV